MAHTILIVDDSPTAAPELRTLLEHEGYQVLTALRGEEALDMLRMSRVDLIITEALLPGMNGFELIRQIRTHDGWAQLPIIMLTVRSAAEDYAASFEAGANEYFVKPMEPPKLLAATRGLIARAEAGRLARLSGAQSAPHVPIHTRSERGEIITVFSLKGGVGTSTIAVNLAVAVKQLAPSARVGLIDLSLEEGIDALLLDIVPTSTILEWAREDLSEATPYLLNQYFIQHRSGISILAAPPSPEDAEIVRSDVVRLTLDLAQQAFDYLVLDTASSFNETSLIALESASSIVLPLTADMAALKTAVSTLRILKAVKINEDNLRFVLNEIVPRAGLTREQVEGSLRRETLTIPHAGAGFIESANQGMPLTTMDPQPPAAKAIFDIARTVCEPEEIPVDGRAAAGQTVGIKGLVNRLGRPRRT